MGEPREGTFAEHVEGAARLTEPAHAMLDPPRPQPLLGDGKPSPGSPSRLPSGIRASSKRTSQWLSICPGWGSGLSMAPMSRSTSTPGVPLSTRSIEARPTGGASRSVTAITMKKSATDALVVYHLRPLSTHSEPSRTRLPAAAWDPSRHRARSSRNTSADGPPAAGAASVPSAPRFRRARGSRCCPRRAPGCRTRRGRVSTCRRSRS